MSHDPQHQATLTDVIDKPSINTKYYRDMNTSSGTSTTEINFTIAIVGYDQKSNNLKSRPSETQQK